MNGVYKRPNVVVSSWQYDRELCTIRNTGVDEAAADADKAGGVDERVQGSNLRRRSLHLLSTIRTIHCVISKQLLLLLEMMKLDGFENRIFAVSQFGRRNPPIDGERGAIGTSHTPVPLI